MHNPFTSPPMPEWNALSNEDRRQISHESEFYTCPCCEDYAFRLYEIIRNQLIRREKRIFSQTMNPRFRVKMRRRII